MMKPITKAQKRKLRELASLAYERELTAALADLESRFEEWRKDEINAFDLSEWIHEFHQGPARELWSIYNELEDDLLVVRALAHGHLKRSEVDQEMDDLLAQQTKAFEQMIRKD